MLNIIIASLLGFQLVSAGSSSGMMRGTIQVDGTVVKNNTLGSISTSPKYKNQFVVSSNKSMSTHFTLPAKNCTSLPPLFAIGQNTTAGFPYFGVDYAPTDNETEPSTSSYGFVYAVGTGYDAPNAIPSSNSSIGYGNSSSSIWSMNCTSGVLNANWVNASGVAIPLEPVDFASAFLIMTANLSASVDFFAPYSAPLAPVSYTFIPSA